eukprot:7166055-Pyramimonas_sp.AAC.1
MHLHLRYPDAAESSYFSKLLDHTIGLAESGGPFRVRWEEGGPLWHAHLSILARRLKQHAGVF